MFLCEFSVFLKMFVTTDDLSIMFTNLQSSFQNDDLDTAADLFDSNENFKMILLLRCLIFEIIELCPGPLSYVTYKFIIENNFIQALVNPEKPEFKRGNLWNFNFFPIIHFNLFIFRCVQYYSRGRRVNSS